MSNVKQIQHEVLHILINQDYTEQGQGSLCQVALATDLSIVMLSLEILGLVLHT